jgi:DnaJ-class molecular chaperone
LFIAWEKAPQQRRNGRHASDFFRIAANGTDRLEAPYKTLGVAPDASPDDIRRAYRKLAQKHHPDLNPGNAKAEEIFKRVTVANELLSDPVKRSQFDCGEIDAVGQERAGETVVRSPPMDDLSC